MGCRPGNNILSPSIYMCWGFPSDYFSRQIFEEKIFENRLRRTTEDNGRQVMEIAYIWL